MRTLTAFIAAMLAATAFARGTPEISFETTASTGRTTERLRSKGIEAFMAEVWTNDVAAPRIHSLFFVEHLPPDNSELVALEMAYRDFGLELARRLDELAVAYQLRKLGMGDRVTLGWLHRFSKWVRACGGYGNYQMARRADALAWVALGRLVVDLGEDVSDFDGCVESFMSEKEEAVIRADILYEESFGTFDVRKEAADFTTKGNFEIRWGMGWKKGFEKHQAFVMDQYSKNKELFGNEDMAICFFADDSWASELSYSVPVNWDLKRHMRTCVYGGIRPRIDKSTVSLHTFRKVVGKFPPPPEGAAADLERAYDDYYDKLWTPHEKKYGIGGGTAGRSYYRITHNEFMDAWTRELIGYMKRHGGKLPWQEKEQEP